MTSAQASLKLLHRALRGIAGLALAVVGAWLLWRAALDLLAALALGSSNLAFGFTLMTAAALGLGGFGCIGAAGWALWSAVRYRLAH